MTSFYIFLSLVSTAIPSIKVSLPDKAATQITLPLITIKTLRTEVDCGTCDVIIIQSLWSLLFHYCKHPIYLREFNNIHAAGIRSISRLTHHGPGLINRPKQ